MEWSEIRFSWWSLCWSMVRLCCRLINEDDCKSVFPLRFCKSFYFLYCILIFHLACRKRFGACGLHGLTSFAAGVDPNSYNRDGAAPLHVAAKLGQLPVIKILVSNHGSGTFWPIWPHRLFLQCTIAGLHLHWELKGVSNRIGFPKLAWMVWHDVTVAAWVWLGMAWLCMACIVWPDDPCHLHC